MIKLHYYPSTAAMVPHIVLEELGVPYERVLVDRAAGAHKRPDYLRLNPNGLLPALQDGELTLYETAAITLHVCDRHPAAGLAPALGTDERAHFYKWVVWLTNTMQATLLIFFYPDRWVGEGDEAAAAALRRKAEGKIAGMLEQMDAHVASHGGAWFLGSGFSALDAYVFTMCRWTRNFPNERRARDYPHLGPYLKRVLARPAVQRVIANEGLAEPFV
jgi:glutathione S-transferase